MSDPKKDHPSGTGEGFAPTETNESILDAIDHASKPTHNQYDTGTLSLASEDYLMHSIGMATYIILGDAGVTEDNEASIHLGRHKWLQLKNNAESDPSVENIAQYTHFNNKIKECI